MNRAYQRWLGTVACAAWLGACGGPARVPAPAPPAATWPLAVFLDTRSYELVGVDASGRALATERGFDGARALAVTAAGELLPLLPAESRSSWVLAATPRGAVIEVGTETGRQLMLVDRAGVGRPVVVTPGVRARFVGVEPDGRALWTAESRGDGSEIVYEHLWSGRPRRLLFEPPHGFETRAIAPGGRRAAVSAQVAPHSDQVLLVDLDRGERRLLLPTGRDGTFRPLRFSARGDRLLFLGSEVGDTARLESIRITDGFRETVLSSECPPRDLLGDMRWSFVRVACDGRLELRSLAPPEPWRDRVPEPLVPIAAARAEAGSWWLGVRAPDAPRDLVRLAPIGAIRPATWGLAPRLDPVRLSRPETASLRFGGAPSPAELWVPLDGSARAIVVWIEPDPERLELGEHRPFLAFLASRGVASIRLALGSGAAPVPGSPDLGREGADEALSRLFDAGRRILIERAGGDDLPTFLVARGGAGATGALRLAARGDLKATAIEVVDPDLPLEPSSAAALERLETPTLLVLDEAEPWTRELLGALEALPPNPALEVRARRLETFATPPGRSALERLWESLSRRLADPP